VHILALFTRDILKDSVTTAHETHSVWVRKARKLILCIKILAVYS